MKTLGIRAYISDSTGYGLLSLQIINYFINQNYDVRVWPYFVDMKGSRESLEPHLVTNLDIPFLDIKTPNHTSFKGKHPRAVYTLWEANRLPRLAVDELNTYDHIITASEWNATLFNASGVNSPIHINHIGVDISKFQWEDPRPDNICVFGTGGNFALGGIRKGVYDMVNIFRRAFPNEPDVRLHIKSSPNNNTIDTQSDNRIVVSNSFLTVEQMAEWYSDLTCYVSNSRSEGWGMMPQEAMACGRPVIAPKFGGIREFYDESVGLPVDFSLGPCEGVYAHDEFSKGGFWAVPDVDDMIAKMRFVYDNMGEAFHLGCRAALRMKNFDVALTGAKLEKTLMKIGIIQ